MTQTTVYSIDKQRGFKLMERALQISLPSSQTVSELQHNLLTYSTIIANMKGQLNILKADNERYRSALSAIQYNNIGVLQEEVIGAYNCLEQKFNDTDKMLNLIKVNGGDLKLDFMIEYNASIQNGVHTLLQLLINLINHEDFDEFIPITPI